jgi:hypothetical protein
VSATRRLRARLIAFPVPEEVAIKRQKVNSRNAQKHRRPVNEQIQNLVGRLPNVMALAIYYPA